MKDKASLFGIFEGIICQQVNCCGVMNAGLAKVIKTQYPQVEEAFNDYYHTSTNSQNRNYKCHFNQLGSFQLVALDKPFQPTGNVGNADITDSGLYVANIYSQDFYGNPSKTGKVYTKLGSLINSIKTIAAFSSLPVYVPFHIGCGFGGEKWENIQQELQALVSDGYDNIYLIDTYSNEIEKVQSPVLEEREI